VRYVHAVREWTSRFAHVVVDEIQDLVGPRALLVQALTEQIPRFTLFGDPAQGIYGWEENPVGPTQDQFLEDLRAATPDLRTHSLTVNHRARSEDARSALEHRSRLLTLSGAREAADDLLREVAELQTVGPLDQAARMVRPSVHPTAVLCQTNVEAARVSDALYENGSDHVLRRAATDRAVAAWIAETARDRRGSLPRRVFEDRYSDCRTQDDLDVDDAWSLLSGLGDDDERVDLGALAARIRRGQVPDELMAPNRASLVVSTIHRAKGLEFDNVVLVQPQEWRREYQDDAELARVLFVALTRARDQMLHLDPVDTSGWRKDERINRWVKCVPGQKWKTLGIEVAGQDVEHMQPAGTWIIEGNGAEIQDYISQHVRRGDRVELRLVRTEGRDPVEAYYAVTHGDRPIGVTTNRFALDLARRSLGDRRPNTIGPVRIDGVDTVAGLESAGADAGLGGSGLWLRPRIAGLGATRWG
jgi:hypothetical protein